MNKKIIGILIVLVLIVALIALKSADIKKNTEQAVKSDISDTKIPVETIVASQQKTDVYIEYVGVVKPMPMQEISFDSIEEIKDVYVKSGMLVKQGDPIIQIEVSNADEDMIDDLFDQLDKKEEAYDEKEEAKDDFEDADEDDDDYDDLKDDYEYLVDVYEVEKNEYEEIRQECLEYFVFCPMDGYVADINTKKGASVYPHQTIAKLGFEENGVVIEMSADAVDTIEVGQTIMIDVDNIQIEGEIFNIVDLPNLETNTYQISISYDTEKYDLEVGQMVSVKLRSETVAGIKIPINIILSDGGDYVFVAKDGIAVKKYIEVESVINDSALVSGIELQDEVVSKGMKNIQSGSRLDVMDEE